MNTPLIGLAGYARTGKDTIGQILVDAHGYERRAFADKLRELAYACDPTLTYLRLWNEDGTESDDGEPVRYAAAINNLGYEGAKDIYPEVRRFLVALGAGARKVLGGDVWLDACLPQPDTGCYRDGSYDAAAPTVVTDVRYANEGQRVVDLGGEVWYIERDNVFAANDEEQRSIAELLNHVPVRVFYNDHALVDLPYVVSRFLTHDPD